MSITELIILAIAVVIVFVLAAGGLRRGPRVTQIDRTVRRKKEDDE